MLTAAWTSLNYHAVQSSLWRSTHRFVTVCAGRGSGKTELSRRRVVRMLPLKRPWPDPEYFYALPTLGQGRKVAWKPIKDLIPASWITSINESTMEIRTVFGSTLRILGLDAPMRAEGLQYDGGIIDESSDQKPGVFDLTFRPALTHRRGWCWRIGVAKRRGIGAREFRKAYEDWGSFNDGIHASFSWPSTDILPAEEIELQRQNMDEKDFKEQYLSSWESNAGLVYYAFDEVASVDQSIAYDRDEPILVGSDFNVDPMAWVIMQRKGGVYRIFDELWIHNTNTPRTLDELHRRYGDHRAGWLFFGDASGRARKSSATQSDYAHIRNDTRFINAKVLYPKANPAVDDRVSSVNALLKNAAGDRRIFIHPRCVHLLRDLGYLSYGKGSRDIDESDPTAKHITDALGYPLHYLSPYRVVRNEEEDAGSVGFTA